MMMDLRSVHELLEVEYKFWYIYCLRTKSRASTRFFHRDLCQGRSSWSSLGLMDLRAAVSKGRG